jgi:23S rRNA pseudouridine2605 synthase
MNELERIAKAIARAGLASRRDAEKMILAGRVCVNGAAVSSPALNVGPDDKIEVDGTMLGAPAATRLFIYHKPAGLTTTHKDENGRKTVFETLPPELGRLVSVGRLDLNSEGLLLLTNDGEFQRFMETGAFERAYRVRVRGVPGSADIAKLARGVSVEGVNYGPIEVSVERVMATNAWLRVVLREGKNREIRKAFESLGFDVNRLIRISYAGIELRNLEPGGIYEVKIPAALLAKFEVRKQGAPRPKNATA